MPEILLQCFPELKFSLSKKRLFYSRSNKKPVLNIQNGRNLANLSKNLQERMRITCFYKEQRYGSSFMR